MKASRGTGTDLKPAKTQEAFGQVCEARGVTPWGGPIQGQEFDLMIFVGPFQYRIIYDLRKCPFPIQELSAAADCRRWLPQSNIITWKSEFFVWLKIRFYSNICFQWSFSLF